jgi:hypothetical protein
MMYPAFGLGTKKFQSLWHEDDESRWFDVKNYRSLDLIAISFLFWIVCVIYYIDESLWIDIECSLYVECRLRYVCQQPKSCFSCNVQAAWFQEWERNCICSVPGNVLWWIKGWPRGDGVLKGGEEWLTRSETQNELGLVLFSFSF